MADEKKPEDVSVEPLSKDDLESVAGGGGVCSWVHCSGGGSQDVIGTSD